MSKIKEVYRYVFDYMVENKGRSPSYDEIMQACNIASKSNVRPILEKLAEVGLVELEDGARGIKLPNSEYSVKAAEEA